VFTAQPQARGPDIPSEEMPSGVREHVSGKPFNISSQYFLVVGRSATDFPEIIFQPAHHHIFEHLFLGLSFLERIAVGQEAPAAQ